MNTPLTDEEWEHHAGHGDAQYVPADFARTLERETIELRAKLEAIRLEAAAYDSFQAMKERALAAEAKVSELEATLKLAKQIQGDQFMRAERAEASAAKAREALQELVRLKMLKDAHSFTVGPEHDAAMADYTKNKPLAWGAAIAALRGGKETTNG